MKSHWTALAAEFDLTPAQGTALRRLEPGKPVPMSSLADLLFCDASNITGIVDKLEARGLIERQASPDDRRVKMLAVTAQGAELRRRFLARSSEPPAAVSGMPPEDQRQLAEILARMVEGYTAAGPGLGPDRT
jgi:DNA-binding MarR family transcriptional regulator